MIDYHINFNKKSVKPQYFFKFLGLVRWVSLFHTIGRATPSLKCVSQNDTLENYVYKLLLLGLDLPRSYSHLLFNGTLARVPLAGVGVLGSFDCSKLELDGTRLKLSGDGVP